MSVGSTMLPIRETTWTCSRMTRRVCRDAGGPRGSPTCPAQSRPVRTSSSTITSARASAVLG
jgi:hypothetical protein